MPVKVPEHGHCTATVFASATMSSSFHCTSGKLLRIIVTTLRYPSAPISGSGETGVLNAAVGEMSFLPSSMSFVLMHFSKSRIDSRFRSASFAPHGLPTDFDSSRMISPGGIMGISSARESARVKHIMRLPGVLS